MYTGVYTPIFPKKYRIRKLWLIRLLLVKYTLAYIIVISNKHGRGNIMMNTRKIKTSLKKEFNFGSLSVKRDGSWVKISYVAEESIGKEIENFVVLHHKDELCTYMRDDYTDGTHYPCITVCREI